MPQRHIPERTCVACRSLRPKREMVRVVRTAAGPREPDVQATVRYTVEIDPTGKKSGRGAYLCRQRECWDVALRRKALERALKTELSETNRSALAAFGCQQAANSDQRSPTNVQASDPAPIADG
jgi:predicted RNA-binding protein YlxR (DUF448 family)